jgi:hypothetical protein
MSAIAWFHVLDRAVLDRALRERWSARATLDVIDAEGRPLDRELFPYSGYVLLDMLAFLDDRGVPVMRSAYDGLTDGDFVIFLTPAHRPALPALDPAAYDPADLRAVFGELDLPDEDLDETAADCLRVLYDGVRALADDEVLAISIG